jgi:hypothetical protein
LPDQAADADVQERCPDADRVHSGQGPGTHDAAYENNSLPPEYIVAEPKGGSATHSSSRAGPDGERYQQGTPAHFQSTNDAMAQQPETADSADDLSRLAPNNPDDVHRGEVGQPLAGAGNFGEIEASRYGDSVSVSKPEGT